MVFSRQSFPGKKSRKCSRLFVKWLILAYLLVIIYATNKLLSALDNFDEANLDVTKSVIISQDSVSSVNKRTEKRLKYILLWNAPHRAETLIFGTGHDSFIDHGCPVNECYIVNSPHQYPKKQLQSYDAIVFNFHELILPKMPPDTKLFKRRKVKSFKKHLAVAMISHCNTHRLREDYMSISKN